MWQRWFALIARYVLEVSGQHDDGKLMSPNSEKAGAAPHTLPGCVSNVWGVTVNLRRKEVPQSETYQADNDVLKEESWEQILERPLSDSNSKTGDRR